MPRATVIRQLLNIVYQTVQLPLALYLAFASEREAVQPLVGADVAKHRFDHRHAVTVIKFALLTVYPALHPVGRRPANVEREGHLPAIPFPRLRRRRVAHASVF